MVCVDSTRQYMRGHCLLQLALQNVAMPHPLSAIMQTKNKTYDAPLSGGERGGFRGLQQEMTLECEV